MNGNEITDKTVYHLSTKDPSVLGLKRDDNEALNKLRAEIEEYINAMFAKLQESLPVPEVELEGIKGEKGDKGDTGATGATGAAGSYTAGNGIDITSGVISVVPADFLDECA